MTAHYEPLAIKFAPELHYVETNNSFKNISPEDLEGFYWRAVESSVYWADVCIQYIAYFKQQRWDSTILDKFFGKPVGSHPNDFAPIFIYLKNEKPVRAVFDIWHYELVGKIDASTAYLHKERGSQFQVKNYYRGLFPLKATKKHEVLKADLELLDQNLLEEWYKGRTFEGDYMEEAKFAIVNKLENPFQRITTFRNSSDLAGTLIEAVIYAFMLKGWPRDIEILEQESREGISLIASKAIELRKAQGATDAEEVKKEDVEKIAEFIKDNILEEPRMLDYLVLSKWEREESCMQQILSFFGWLAKYLKGNV
ncbi:MAG: hypothetical protein PVF58_20055 [Candidatus Methanofastidiosia archaeon]|jgi:hypothetical protein